MGRKEWFEFESASLVRSAKHNESYQIIITDLIRWPYGMVQPVVRAWTGAVSWCPRHPRAR